MRNIGLLRFSMAGSQPLSPSFSIEEDYKEDRNGYE
jgi:hypothetical protein